MKIVVWGINYAPEVTGIAPYNTALCRFLVERGHEVTMMTTFPYYPQWKKQPEDRGRWRRREMDQGVAVCRTWHYVPATPRTLTRILHEGSFVLTSVLWLLGRKRPDLYVVISPPLLLGLAAWLLSLLHKRPFVFHVQDLQPDAAAGLGMVRKGLFLRLLYRLEALAYAKAARVSGISSGMLEAYREKNLPSEKILFFPNWVSCSGAKVDIPQSQTHAMRERHGWRPDDFVVFYSGNMGVKQGLDILLSAASLARTESTPTSSRRVLFVLAGEGADKARLLGLADDLQLDNVCFLPLQPEEDYQVLLRTADLPVVTQQTGTGQFFFPSKVLSLLAAGRPVLTVADPGSELDRAVGEGGFGRNVPPGNPAALLSVCQELAGSPALLQKMAGAGTEWVAQFDAKTVLPAFESELLRVASGSGGAATGRPPD